MEALLELFSNFHLGMLDWGPCIAAFYNIATKKQRVYEKYCSNRNGVIGKRVTRCHQSTRTIYFYFWEKFFFLGVRGRGFWPCFFIFSF